TTALDVTIQAQILDLLKKLQKEFGMSLILITHNLGVVAGMCDKIAVMYAGRMVEEASAEQLFANPMHPYTRGLLKSVPRLDEARQDKLFSVRDQPPDLSKLPAGCYFHPRCDLCEEKCHEENPGLIDCGAGQRAACWVTTKETSR
ncbi:MAG: glutathione ABC transporter ATP-binding protein, partial [Deltaproteobacteria bacterium]|nr:glutathione ABC transporter ATP-binding protein [Deltaproteobacteria bacterium]